MASPTGPGILYVNSKIFDPNILDEATYVTWYDDDHIPEILATGSVDSAWHSIDVDKGRADKPYLAMYPLKDIAWGKGTEFASIGVHSEMLPNGGPIFDVAGFDVRFLSLVQVFDPTNKGKGHTKTIISEQLEPGPGLTVDELDRWYREEHLERLTQVDGYLRTARFKLAFASSNTNLRALKGLGTSDELPHDPPTWLALHEFSTNSLDLAEIEKVTGSDWTTKVLENAKIVAFPVFRLAKTHGNGDWFHGVEV